MSIWFQDVSIDAANALGRKSLTAHVGIELTEAGDDYLKGRMPVDHRTRQSAGLLHGGASVVLAETLASWGALLVIDTEQQSCVGLEINANHVRSAREGYVTGTARPLHLGKSTQVWDVRIIDDRDKLVCVSRVTMAILDTPFHRPVWSDEETG